MKIEINWQKPIQVTHNKRMLFDAKSIPESVQTAPGVYFFSRKFGNVLLPFYIGETVSIYHRLRNHLKNVDIVDVLRGYSTEHEIRNGARFFHFGYLKGNFNKENTKKRLQIVQRYMIRAAIELDIPVLNKNLTKVSTHSIQFAGNAKGRGEYLRHASAEAK